MPISQVGLNWRGMGIALICLGFVTVLVVPTRGATIFDDDWTPPVATKPPTAPPAEVPVTTPAKSPGSAASDSHQKPPASPTPTPPAPAATPALRAIPAKADQAKSRKVFKEVFATELADRSPAARRAFAAKLLEQAANVNDVPSDQFVLFVGAAEAAKEGADLKAAIRAIDSLAEAYEVDGLRFKREIAFGMPLRATSRELTNENCSAGLELADQLAAADDFATASRLFQNLKSASLDSAFVTQIQSRIKELDTLRTAADRIATFRQKLKSSPDDPAANLAVGQYLCLIKNDWTQGIPLLGRGDDPALKALARIELDSASPHQSKVLAEGWWDYGHRKGIQSAYLSKAIGRSAHWYTIALPDLSGLDAELAKKRIAEAAGAHQPDGKTTFLTELTPVSRKTQGDWFATDGSMGSFGKHIVVRGEVSPHGIFLHAIDRGYSELVYQADPAWRTFSCGVAIPRPGNATASLKTEVRFAVLSDGKVVWSSKPLADFDQPQWCEVSVANSHTLTLRVYCSGAAQYTRTVWLEPRVKGR